MAVHADRDDLALERPSPGGRVGEAMRADGELVELRPRELVLVGDQLGAETLAYDLVAGQQLSVKAEP